MGSIRYYDDILTNLGSSVQRMMKLTPYLYRTRWMTRATEIDEWTDESGRIVLMGEAAHPWFVSSHILALCSSL